MNYCKLRYTAWPREKPDIQVTRYEVLHTLIMEMNCISCPKVTLILSRVCPFLLTEVYS